MSDSIVRSPRLAARRRAVRAERRRRKRRVLLGIVLVAALGAGGVALSRSLLFGLAEISVAGVERVAEKDVIAASGLRMGESAVGIDLDAVAARVRALPGVRDVRVERDGALGIRITVVERRPAVEIRSGGERRYLDQDGQPIAGIAPGGRIPTIVVERDATRLLPPGTAATILTVWERLPERMRARIDSFAVPRSGHIEFRMGATLVVFGRVEHVDEKVGAIRAVTARARAENRTVLRIDVRAPARPAAVIR